MTSYPIHGEVHDAFTEVRAVFEANFSDIEVGASVCVYHHGEKVVDLWGGYLDEAGSAPWQRDTLVNVYSTTKGLASMPLAVLADQGLLDYEAKVSEYWPEFSAAGKAQVTVAQLLSHQAGVPGLRRKVTVDELYDLDGFAAALAAAEPLWPPGSAAGYHAMNWGHLANAIAHRITGKTLGTLFRELIAEPLQADVHIGVPEDALCRCGGMIGPNRARIKPDVPEPQMPELYPVALANPAPRPFKDVSTDRWRQAEIAAANAHANGESVARCYAAFAEDGELDGVRVISASGIDNATIQEVDETPDLVLGRPMRRARGFALNTEAQYGPSQSAFGHAGAGGSLGFADREHHIGFGYVMNQMQPLLDGDSRCERLVQAVYQALERA